MIVTFTVQTESLVEAQEIIARLSARLVKETAASEEPELPPQPAQKRSRKAAAPAMPTQAEGSPTPAVPQPDAAAPINAPVVGAHGTSPSIVGTPHGTAGAPSTLAQVRAALQKVADEHGMTTVTALVLKHGGVARISDLKPEQYDALIKAAAGALGGAT